MRKLFLILVILLSSCSLQDVLNFPVNQTVLTSTPVDTSTPTSTFTPTSTPTVTPTTTIVRIPTQDFLQPTATTFVISIFAGANTITPVPTRFFFQPGNGFLSVSVSEKKIFWGSCEKNNTVVTTKIENPDDVYSVVIFVRVKSAEKEDYTPWTTGDVMVDNRDGTYSYKLVGVEIEGHNHYKNSLVFFQLVATNKNGIEIGRTPVFTDYISLSPCM